MMRKIRYIIQNTSMVEQLFHKILYSMWEDHSKTFSFQLKRP